VSRCSHLRIGTETAIDGDGPIDRLRGIVGPLECRQDDRLPQERVRLIGRDRGSTLIRIERRSQFCGIVQGRSKVAVAYGYEPGSPQAGDAVACAYGDGRRGSSRRRSS